jgi:hypothetical protein
MAMGKMRLEYSWTGDGGLTPMETGYGIPAMNIIRLDRRDVKQCLSGNILYTFNSDLSPTLLDTEERDLYGGPR